MNEIRVWDLPVRVFHWALVLLVTTSWITAQTGFDEIHEWSGYSVLTLVVFRILWGLFGSENARFSRFLTPPAVAWDHLKATSTRTAPHYDTHNPAGGWMVIALLLMLLLQAGTGLFSSDDILFEGPFAAAVSSQWSEWAKNIHARSFNIMLALVAVHVLAVGLHELHGERLIKAMWFGSKRSDQAAAAQRPLWLAAIVLALAIAAVWGLLSLAPPVSAGF